MPIVPIANERISDQIVNQILQMVRDGEIKPGDKLPSETQFAEQFGISRGILREALMRLQAQGYIRRKPKDGTYLEDHVPSLMMNQSVMDLMKKSAYADLLDFRQVLEVRMAELVIDRASDEEIQELCDALDAPATDDSEQHNMDHYFHYRLAVASRNVFFMSFIDTYYDMLSEVAQQSKRDQARRDQILKEHAAIAAAIRVRDKHQAAEAVRYHMRMVDQKIKSM